MGRSLIAKVPSIIDNAWWNWTRSRNQVTQEIIDQTSSSLVHQVEREDRVEWIPSASGTYSSKSAWQASRTVRPMVPWYIEVLFSKHVKSWCFVVRMVVLGKLTTRDRLVVWGITADGVLFVFTGHEDSHLL